MRVRDAMMTRAVGKAFFYLPEGWHPKLDILLSPRSARFTRVDGPLRMQEVTFAEDDFA